MENLFYPTDPLFIYIHLNETSITIRDELISWLNYKPIRGDDELLNLLILELFDDYTTNNQQTSLNQNESKLQKSFVKQPSFTNESSNVTQSSFQLRQRQNVSVTSTHSIQSSSTITSKKSRQSDATIAMGNTKPTLIDTYYDLLKSLHLHITIKPVRINLKKTQTENPNDNLIGLCLPKVKLTFEWQ